MGRVHVKICGITTIEDAVEAIDAGADAIGLNMVSGPREIDAARAAEILSIIHEANESNSGVRPEPVMLVNAADAVACNESLVLARRFAVRTIQLYGDDRGEHIGRLGDEGFKIWLPHAVQPGHFPDSLHQLLAQLSQPPTGVVLDAHHHRLAGGTGIALDWRRVRDAIGEADHWPPIILAGGLTPDNVAEAIRIVQPYAVDVSSGVEMEPGRKDAERMTRFVQSVRGSEW